MKHELTAHILPSPDKTTRTKAQVVIPNEVQKAYQDGLAERSSTPDKLTWDAKDIVHLDKNLIALPEDIHPRLWPPQRKWVTTTLVGSLCFLAPFTATIFAPSIDLVMEDLGMTDPIDGALQTAVFLFAFAIAPLFLAPLSEIYGRKRILLAGNVVFIVFGVGGGFSRTPGQLVACRFLAGVGGSSSFAIFGGILADLFDLKDRAKASGVLYFTIILGPVAGPACGGWMSERASWRWTCWVPAIAAFVVHIFCQVLLKECYIPTLLRRRLKECQKQDPHLPLYTALDICAGMEQRSGAVYMLTEAFRPVIYLCVDPALFIVALVFAVLFGTLYMIIVTFYQVFSDGYGHSPGIVGIDLLSEGIGAMIGMFVTVRLLDVVYLRASGPGKTYKPETRLVPAFGGTIVTAAGLFIYGFSAGRTHFIVPLIGVAVFSAGSMNVGLAIQLYAVDCFQFPASAVAAISTFRCVLGGVFPLFGQRLFDALGIDWGIGLLAFLALGIGTPAIPLLYLYGKPLRGIGTKNFKRITGQRGT